MEGLLISQDFGISLAGQIDKSDFYISKVVLHLLRLSHINGIYILPFPYHVIGANLLIKFAHRGFELVPTNDL